MSAPLITVMIVAVVALVPLPLDAQLRPISGSQCSGVGIFCTGDDSTLDLALRVEAFVWAAIALLFTAALIFLVYAGYKYITSTGSEEIAAQAKRQIVYAILGMIFAGTAFTIRNVILTATGDFRGGGGNPQAAAGILIFESQRFIDLALYLIGTAAVIFLIYAGYKYISSQGEEDASAQAKRQIAYAILGIVVAAGARIITGAFIDEGDKVLVPRGSAAAGQSIVNNLVTPVVNALLVLVGVAAAAYVIMAGVMYFSSQGDEQRAEAAKQQLIYGVIGIAVILLSAAIVNFVIRAIV